MEGTYPNASERMFSEHVKMHENEEKSAPSVVFTAWMIVASSLSISYVF